MKRIILECKCDESQNEFYNGIFTQKMMCSSSTTIILKDNEYCVLTIPKCYLGYESMCCFIEKILKQIAKEFYNIDRGWLIDKSFRDLRLRGTELKQHTFEINYFYFDNARKKYSIVTKKPYVDYIFSQEKRDLDYKETMDFLIKNDIDLVGYLKDLHSDNTYHVSDYEVSKNIESLIKKINKTI